MTNIKKLCFAALFSTLLWVACGSPVIYKGDAGDHTHVVARVDTFYDVTMAELYDSVYTGNTLPNGGVLSAHDVKLFLDSMLCDSLAGLAARDVRLGDYYQNHRMYRLRYQKALLQTFLDEIIYGRVTADSAEIHDFYLSRPDLFSGDEQVLLHHILVSSVNLKHGPDSAYYWSLSSEEFDAALEDYALRLRNLIDIGIPFDEVARDYSHDTYTGQHGGFVGWTKKGIYFPPFDSVAFSLHAGEIAQYTDRDGWHIILVAEHVDEGLPPFGPDQYEASEQTLLTIKANTRGREVMDSLRAEPQDIVYNEEVLDTNVYLVNKQVWAAIVNGADTIDFNELRTLEEKYRRENQVSNTTLEMKKQMISRLAERYIILQSAWKSKLDTLPYVAVIEARLRHTYSKMIVERDRRDPSWVAPESLVRAYYNEHLDEFKVEKPMRIQHIIVEDSTFGEFLRDQAMAGVDFMELALRHYPGDSSIRETLADLGDIGQTDVPPELWMGAITTPVGEISHPVKTTYGYHIIKVLRHQDMIDLERAKPSFLPLLHRQHALEVFAKYRDRLYDDLNVSFPGRIHPVHLEPLEHRTK